MTTIQICLIVIAAAMFLGVVQLNSIFEALVEIRKEITWLIAGEREIKDGGRK